MNPRSDALFHFTKQVETLHKILENGFWPRYCLEDVSWLGYEEVDYIGYPMVCFCDIPLSRIKNHQEFYGSFGIGMTKEWGVKNGLNPVFYSSDAHSIKENLKKLNRFSNMHSDKKNKATARKALRYLLAYMKPLKGKMSMGAETKEVTFYHESEWRYVPVNDKIKDHIRETEFRVDARLFENNEKTKENCMIKFTPEDIKYIFVKSDNDIPGVVNLIHDKLDNYTLNQQKILYSRIISLESLDKDI